MDRSDAVFISRHPGAREWAARRGFTRDRIFNEWRGLPPDAAIVAGALPVHLAAQICSAGSRYFHLEMNVPSGHRDRELTADEMEHSAQC